MQQDFRFAIRQLIRQPGISLAAIVTLGLGLAASLAVFTLVNAVLLRPLPYPDPDRIVTIARGIAGNQGALAHRDVRFLREHVRGCAPIAATVSGSGLNMSVDGATSYAADRLVSNGYFAALGIQPRWGRAFTADEDVAVPPPVVVLNERFVRQQNLDPAAIVGRGIQLAGRTHTVVGVLAAEHTRPFDADIYRPLGNDARGGGQNLEGLCRLEPSASLAALNAELAGLLEEARQLKLAGARTTIPYSAVSRHEWEFGSLRPQLNTLLLAVALVLLVAGANTTGLLLVRASGRRREIAVRTALGASPGRIARTLVAEGLLLAAVSVALGLIAAPLLVRGLLAVAPAYYVELASFTIDGTVIAIAIALCLLVGLAVALPPLMEVLRVNVRDTLQEEGRSGMQGRRTIWMRHLLIGAETAVSAVLLVGALLLLRTFVNLMQVNTGVDSNGVITARMSIQGPQYDDVPRLIQFFEEGVRRLQQSAAVEAAAVGASLPAERALNLPAVFLDRPTSDSVEIVNWRYVTPGYFDLLKMRTVAGRPLGDLDRAGAPLVAVVNETFARQVYGGVPQALGKQISVAKQPPRAVVGVVSDTSGWSLREPSRPLMFVPLAQVEPALVRTAHSYFPPRWIVRSRGDIASARRELEAIVRELDPSQPFIEIQTLNAMMINSVAMQRFYLVVLSAFALFAVGLAAVGIYAAYSYSIASRTAEIGVRLALGAKPSGILIAIVRHALVLGAIATAAGLAAAAGAAKVLRSVLFDVTETDPLTYLAVGATLLLTVAAATMIPAIRAARVDPLVALRR
jgi:putative ABC transport system permease protein